MQKQPWILIVEDDSALSEMLSQSLLRIGYRALTAKSAGEALRLVQNQRFGCIVLDYKLQTGTGDQIVAAVRKSEMTLNYQTPILLISGLIQIDELQKIRAGISGALIKPFGREDFAAKIQSLCPLIRHEKAV